MGSSTFIGSVRGAGGTGAWRNGAIHCPLEATVTSRYGQLQVRVRRVNGSKRWDAKDVFEVFWGPGYLAPGVSAYRSDWTKMKLVRMWTVRAYQPPITKRRMLLAHKRVAREQAERIAAYEKAQAAERELLAFG